MPLVEDRFQGYWVGLEGEGGRESVKTERQTEKDIDRRQNGQRDDRLTTRERGETES